MVNFLSIILPILFFVLAPSGIQGQSDHTLQLYDGPLSSPGSWISVNNYVENLQNYAFNDLASSMCVIRGIWLFYENPSYNSVFLGLSAFYWGENFCEDLPTGLNNQVSSVRYAGSPYGFQADSINIYQVDWFQSYEVFAATDSLDLSPYYGGSIIVTGRSYWTIYDSPNYQGYRVCVSPADITYAYPGFYTQASEFGFSGRVIRSARRGCWTENNFRPTFSAQPGKLYRRN
ncbi:uncharacterized protein LOC116918889 [Daphnia magna]|uniref:Uncharacterized protein n=2 Tax=Daphnia magna TaxID=35525 RepID=A0A164SJM3_9CRUS|nr:uncharacterized protein LOC116918889 [Daphnia magna]KAK4024960.1 hypothetical protein OUZ56_010453 [Daphnia magna]KZS09691.1 Uncharacterized protein APZ42_025989 [Daphnia magna]